MRLHTRLVGLAFWIVAGAGLLAAQQSIASPEPTGTGSIVGTVVDGATNAPMPNARVTVSADGSGAPTPVITDGLGRFAFDAAPAGRLFLSSVLTGHTAGYVGTRSPFDRGQWLELSKDETIPGVVLRMWKHVVVSGSAVDAIGEPLVAATVTAARLQIVGGRKTLVAARQVRTDDRGLYRFADLVPADYAFVLMSPATLSPTSKAFSASGYATQFYPDSASPSQSTILTIRGGEERAGVDFHASTPGAYSVAGTVTGGTPGAPRPVQLSLRPVDSTRIPTTVDVRYAGLDSAGRFVFRGLGPGAYVIDGVPPPPSRDIGMLFLSRGDSTMIIRTVGAGAPPTTAPVAMLSTRVPVVVEDRNIEGLEIVLKPGPRITGRVVVDTTGEQKLPPTAVHLVSADGRDLGLLPVLGVREDGTFETPSVPPGQYGLVARPTLHWYLTSISVGGREMLGVPLTLDDADLSVVLTFSNRPTRLMGTVRDEAGAPLPNSTIYAFSTDRRTWTNAAPGSGVSLAITPIKSATFQSEVLPGEYFIVAANTTARDDWRSTEVLEMLSRSAKAQRIAVGQTVTLDLVVPKGQ